MINNYFYRMSFWVDFINKYFYFIVFLLLIFVFYKIFKAELYQKKQMQETMMMPDINSMATVFSKALRTVKAGYGSRSIPYVAFEFPDGSRKDFECDMSIYLTLKEGDSGNLTYKEKDGFRIFINFMREH